jgi:AraC-like DNA-binding protein
MISSTLIVVDAFSAFLDGPRAKSAFLLKAVMSPPWSIRVEDRAPLTVIAVARGEAWTVDATGVEFHLREGDVAVVREPEPYLFADSPATPPQAIIHPGQRCTTIDGHDLAIPMGLGVRTWGNDPDGDTVTLVGTYEQVGESGRMLLDALPPMLALAADEWDSPLVGLLEAEITRADAGQSAVLDRLLDLVLVAAVRAWFAGDDRRTPGWYRAQSDPVVGRVMNLIHDHPEQPWSVASLAAEAGASRAWLARRFHELVGRPPMEYLTEVRLSLAADLLVEPGVTVASVSARVGYATPYSFSAAFKRVRGVNPSSLRGQGTPQPPPARTAARSAPT